MCATFLDAHACSGLACVPGILPASGAVVPANTGAILWDPDFAKASGHWVPTTTTAKIIDLVTLEVVPHRFQRTPRGLLVHLEGPLTPGREYAFQAQDCFGSGYGFNTPSRSTFTATVAAPLPQGIGTLRVVEKRLANLFPPVPTEAVCMPGPQYLAAIAEVELMLDESARPFEPLFFLQLKVDGRPIPQLRGTTYIQVQQRLGQGYRAPRGRDWVELRCSAGLESQRVAVTMEAELPGARLYETPPLLIDLDCRGADAGVEDASVADVATTPEAGIPERLVEEQGCGCSSNEPRQRPSVMLMLLGGFVVWWAFASRRRRAYWSVTETAPLVQVPQPSPLKSSSTT
jgi:hypothetical protein